MKKLLVILGIALITFYAQAQVNYGPGLMGGLNISTIKGDDAEGFKELVRFFGGIFCNLKINDKFSIQPELVYSAQGAKFKDASNAQLNLNYINLTGALRYNTESGINIFAGPQLGLLLIAKEKYDNITDNVKELFKDLNAALSAGVGVDTRIGIGIDVRISLGLSEISSQPDPVGSSFMILLGARYYGGRLN